MAVFIPDNSTYYATDVWSSWNQTTASTGSNAVAFWTVWVSNATAETAYPRVHPRPSARQVAARGAEVRKEWEEAQRKANQLLEEHLDDEQREELSKHGYFHVHTKRGVYRLRRNGLPLFVKGGDGQQYSYCIHPAEGFPDGDKLLAIKLLLETDEQEFLRIANAARCAVLT